MGLQRNVPFGFMQTEDALLTAWGCRAYQMQNSGSWNYLKDALKNVEVPMSSSVAMLPFRHKLRQTGSCDPGTTEGTDKAQSDRRGKKKEKYSLGWNRA